jgi:hypothetical protein
MTTKVCTKCGEEKSMSEFYKAKLHKDGRRSECKECRYVPTKKQQREAGMRWNRKNKKKVADNWKRYYLENKETIKENRKKRYHENNGVQKAATWRDANRDKIRGKEKEQCELLADQYIIHQIYSKTGLAHTKIKEHPKSIEQYRQYLIRYRKQKQFKNGKLREENNRI